MLTDKAMKAEELRIGNIIALQGKPVSVNLSTLERLLLPELSRYQRFAGQYKPIPLSEEWLVKFGFRYSEPLKMHVLYSNPATCEPDDYEDSVYHNVDFFYNGECFGFEVSNEWGENGNLMMSKIKHVHQLQNLYFALTGEELTP